MSSSRKLGGLTVAITGGARGIGLATAKELHARGARVAIGDIDGDLAVDAAESISTGTIGRRLDVSDRESFRSFIEAAGPIDVLINNAGIMPIGHFTEQSVETQRRALEVNVMGCLNGLAVALPAMVERGAGHIVNVASTAGRTPVPGGIVYCATKSAVVALTETARVEYGGTGVDFTCVMPHFTNTELIDGTTATKLIPLVEPADVAAAICGAIEHRRKDVFVPRMIGPLLRSQPLLGRRLRDAMGRRLGAYDTFLSFDHERRAAYDSRVDKS